MDANFLRVHREFTAEFEGGYNDIKEDRGGATNWGISLNFLKGYASHQQHAEFLIRIGVYLPITVQTIKNLTKDQSEKIFERAFWHYMECQNLPLHVGFMLYDCSVNHGYGGATKIAQRAYNALSPSTPLIEDGRYGPLTKQAISRDSGQGFIELWVRERENYYTSIVEHNHSQVKFINGWMRRASEMGQYALSLI